MRTQTYTVIPFQPRSRLRAGCGRKRKRGEEELEWPDFVCWSGRKSRARVVEKFGAKQAKEAGLVETRKSKQILAKPLNLIE
ncbi:hypothetical protein TIFTF001_039734, partial [Ficus carica]